MDKAFGGLAAIIGLASLALVVSKRSDTARVLDAGLGGLNKLIRGAVSPVTGK